MCLNRIRILRMRNNLKQEELSKIINVSQASLSGYESGKYEPDNKTIVNLAVYFDVTTDYLLGNDHIPESLLKQAKKIPVLRSLRAGLSAENATEFLCYEENNQNVAGQEDFFALEMRGDSMEPRIQDGDVVIVHKQAEVKSGDVAVVLISKDEATIKKIIKHQNGLTLIPYNPKYDPATYSKEEITRLPIVVIGKAVELRGKC
jgi:repressor LexA